MGLSQSSSRTMRWLLPWRRIEGVLPYLLLTIAGLMLIAAVWSERRSADRQTDLATSRLAVAAAQSIADSVGQFDRTLQAMISRQQSPELQAQDPSTRNAALFERIQREPYFSFIDVLNPMGHSVAGLSPSANDWSDRDYFKALRYNHSDRLFIGGRFSADRGEKNVGFTVSRRMNDGSGDFAGLVVMGVRLSYFRDLLEHLDLGPRYSAMLLREDGLVLMRLPFDLNNIGDTLDHATPFYMAMKAKEEFATTTDPIDHVERRFALYHLQALPLIVSVGLATESLSENPMLWWVASAGLSALFACALLQYRQWSVTRRRAAAERESQEKSQFLTTLSHELRTPLHGVLGYAEQLSREGALSGAALRQVSEIIRSARHMRDVVNIVLDYARIEALGPALHMRRIDVRGLAEECVAVIDPGARARGLETRIAMAAGTPAHFVTDDIQLRQALINLLSNAVKYTPFGRVELRLTGDAEHLTVEVADTGIGIPECQRHRLFREYERFGTERTSIEGTGLGLAIAHRLIRRMGGHMGHRNNPGGGSVFWLELPAGAADQVEPEAEPAMPEPKRPLKVLVVDDSEVNRKVTASYLRAAGHEAAEAADGSEAVGLAVARDFDVVLMDMRMPGMDGLEAARRIRALGAPRSRVPIVAVTANALDHHAEECRRAGMSEHLAKPFTQAELSAVLARAVPMRPPAEHDAAPTIDAESLAQVTSAMGEEGVQRLLDCLALRIESLLRALEAPSAFASPDALAALAHELKGSGGTLGFARLASAAGDFESAIAAAGTADADAIRCAATAALEELRRRRSLEALAPV
jgi:signal transduction histidine kinase/CheY-like chemotaxis protein/HPt (histidine-containing phosphotransfer) domain-containing protein